MDFWHQFIELQEDANQYILLALIVMHSVLTHEIQL